MSLKVFRNHRDDADRVLLEDVFCEVNNLAEEFGIDLTLPRQCSRQAHRLNIEGLVEEYYRRTTYMYRGMRCTWIP